MDYLLLQLTESLFLSVEPVVELVVVDVLLSHYWRLAARHDGNVFLLEWQGRRCSVESLHILILMNASRKDSHQVPIDDEEEIKKKFIYQTEKLKLLLQVPKDARTEQLCREIGEIAGVV